MSISIEVREYIDPQSTFAAVGQWGQAQRAHLRLLHVPDTGGRLRVQEPEFLRWCRAGCSTAVVS